MRLPERAAQEVDLSTRYLYAPGRGEIYAARGEAVRRDELLPRVAAFRDAAGRPIGGHPLGIRSFIDQHEELRPRLRGRSEPATHPGNYVPVVLLFGGRGEVEEQHHHVRLAGRVQLAHESLLLAVTHGGPGIEREALSESARQEGAQAGTRIGGRL